MGRTLTESPKVRIIPRQPMKTRITTPNQTPLSSAIITRTTATKGMRPAAGMKGTEQLPTVDMKTTPQSITACIMSMRTTTASMEATPSIWGTMDTPIPTVMRVTKSPQQATAITIPTRVITPVWTTVRMKTTLPTVDTASMGLTVDTAGTVVMATT